MTGFRPFFNPATGEWIEFTAVAEDSDGQLVRFSWRSVPGGVITEHVHPCQEERFIITSGEARFTLAGEELTARAGDTIVVPAGVPHSEGNPGRAEIQAVVELRPALRSKEFHEAVAGLAADGRTTSRGAPRNPLQLGATFWHFRHESRVTSPPIGMQNLMLPPLWAVAKAFGVRPYYTRWDSRIPIPDSGEGRCDTLVEDTVMNVTDPIRRVSVVSTGQVQIRPDHVASTWRPTAVWLLASRTWTGPRPINAYVIEHRDGLVLFDTGQDRASVTEADYFPGGVSGFLYGRLARFDISTQQTLTAGLDRLGYPAGDVTTAVISHLHQDHIGGLAELSRAEIVVSQAEWDTLSSPLPELRGLMRRHIDLPGLRWRRITPEPAEDPGLAPFRSGHDLFGDGSLVVLPTPGHTPGSISLLVRRPGRPTLLMVGDVSYDAHVLEAGHVPGVGNRRHLRETTAMVNQMRQHHPGLAILPAHDPGAADRLAQATGQTPELASA
jgi:N-acyl homoserine lactone hydrolase